MPLHKVKALSMYHPQVRLFFLSFFYNLIPTIKQFPLLLKFYHQIIKLRVKRGCPITGTQLQEVVIEQLLLDTHMIACKLCDK